MSLLNKSNKTKVHHTIRDICENINVNILGDAQDTPTELIRRVAGLDASILWEEWAAKTVPTLGLECYGKLDMIGHTYRKQYIFFISTANPDGSTTTYKVSISFDHKKIDDMQLREYQQRYIKNGKWYSEIVSGNFKKYNHGTSK